MTTLEDVDQEIRRAILGYKLSGLKQLEYALDAGKGLLTARKHRRRGEWTPYVQGLQISTQTARNWMRLAVSGSHANAIAHFGGERDFLDFLASSLRDLRPDQIDGSCSRIGASGIPGDHHPGDAWTLSCAEERAQWNKLGGDRGWIRMLGAASNVAYAHTQGWPCPYDSEFSEAEKPCILCEREAE